jgi:hypothetical protein
MKNKSWASIEINKIKETARKVGWGRINKSTLIYSLAHGLAKANRKISKLEREIIK